MTRRVLCVAVLLLGGVGAASAADLENTMALLKGAEGQKNIAEIKSLAVEAIKGGLQEASVPEPATDKEAWKERVDYAKSVQSYGEYALFTAALQAPAATKVDLISALEGANPKSKYLDQAYGMYLVALNETGAAAKISAIAEKGLVSFPNNEDLLSVLAEGAIQKGQQDTALKYATRIVAVMSKETKPEEMSAADFEKKKTTMLGRAYYISGAVYFAKNQFTQADKSLRAALPYIKGNDAMTGQALFQLGVANYRIGQTIQSRAKVLEGAKFSEEASKIQGSWAQQAYTNAQLMKNEAPKYR